MDSRLQVVTLALANLAVAARVGPQLFEFGGPSSDAVVGLSGLLAYAALVLFTINVVRTLRGPVEPPPAQGGSVPMELRLSPR